MFIEMKECEEGWKNNFYTASTMADIRFFSELLDKRSSKDLL